MSINIVNKVICFLQKQIISPVFNRNKQKLKQIATKISQKLLILLI
jgi:hypothetical protein